jgi:hypothetical protein
MCVIVALALSAGPAAQQPQRFRSGVDLITVDVTALDARGVPVEDLRADDFTVKVDGKARRVVAADLVKVDSGSCTIGRGQSECGPHLDQRDCAQRAARRDRDRSNAHRAEVDRSAASYRGDSSSMR